MKKACLEYDKDLNIQSYNLKLDKTNENIFNDDFFEELDFLFSGVDNMETRHLIQKHSIFYDKIFFDAGTLGMDCNFYQFIPYETCTLYDIPKPKLKQTPLCTIHNHPYAPNHIIEWAKIALFDVIFHEDIINLKKKIDNIIEGCEIDLNENVPRIKIYVKKNSNFLFSFFFRNNC